VKVYTTYKTGPTEELQKSQVQLAKLQKGAADMTILIALSTGLSYEKAAIWIASEEVIFFVYILR